MRTKTQDTIAVTLQHPRPHMATKEEAMGLDREATQIVKAMKRGWLSLGLVMKRMSETQAFEQLGFRSMRAWMESRLGEQMASAYQSLRAVRALDGVPESKLEKVGTRNAQLLVRLPEKVRKSDEWIDKAATLSERALRAEVDALIEGKTHMPKEQFRYWGEAVPESVAQKLDEMMTKIGRVLEVDITERPGRITALEALAATILNTTEELLKTEIEGDEGQSCGFYQGRRPYQIASDLTAGERR
jgi:hypothetical protein